MCWFQVSGTFKLKYFFNLNLNQVETNCRPKLASLFFNSYFGLSFYVKPEKEPHTQSDQKTICSDYTWTICKSKILITFVEKSKIEKNNFTYALARERAHLVLSKPFESNAQQINNTRIHASLIRYCILSLIFSSLCT